MSSPGCTVTVTGRRVIGSRGTRRSQLQGLGLYLLHSTLVCIQILTQRCVLRLPQIRCTPTVRPHTDTVYAPILTQQCVPQFDFRLGVPRLSDRMQRDRHRFQFIYKITPLSVYTSRAGPSERGGHAGSLRPRTEGPLQRHSQNRGAEGWCAPNVTLRG
jgi:hypothetical protein